MTFVNTPTSVRTCRNFIAGEFVDTQDHRAVHSPWTNQKIATMAISTKNDVTTAVDAAHKAFPLWKQLPIKERTQLLFKFRSIVLERIDAFANAAAIESGKTVAEGKAGVMKGLEVCEYALSLQNLDSGGALDVSRGVTCEYRREPLGVVVGVVPFNFPAMVPMWMYPIALTLGNCFILKPSEKVPMTSQLVAEAIRDAGFPAGVFQLVHGAREVVEYLIDDPRVTALAFVGSSPVAKSLYQRTTSLGKRALCLGGAKNALIVVPDADEQIAVRGVVDSFTGCAGQRCMAASLMIAVGDVDSLIQKIVQTAKSIELGKNMGAIIDEAAMTRIASAIEQASRDGAKIILDGRKALPPKGYEKGNWMGPTIIDHASSSMACAKEEIFGPVITIIRVPTLKEAMELDALSEFGNATSVFTTSGSVARYVAEHATSGMIGINVGVPVPREPFSFGGTKASKFGALDITGDGGVEFWTQRKKITMKWSEQIDRSWMS
jgi:malonate-semialdehyde dehydrogenase (acetylating)/methylmalonate-semialdehyde dehydrogenase